MSEVDVASGRYVRSFDVPREPEAIGMPADGREVWIGSNAEGKVSVVDPATGTVKTAAEGLTPDGRFAFLSLSQQDRVALIRRHSS